MTEIVHYLPDWLPFEFKRIGARGKDLQLKMRYWAWGETVKHFVRRTLLTIPQQILMTCT